MARGTDVRRVPLILMAILLLLGVGCTVDDTTGPEADLVPEILVTPESGSVELGIPVTLTWTLDDRWVWEDSVIVHCDTLEAPETMIYEGADAGFAVGDLLQDRTYYWCVTATDSSGSVHDFGPWSFAVRPFRCQLTPHPDHLTVNLEIDPILQWSIASASDSVSYYLAYVDTVNPPQHLAYAGPDSSFQMTDLEYETTYYWRVTAVDAADNTDTTGPWRFDTGPPVFMVDLAPTPADSTRDLDRVVDLSWVTSSSTAPVENWVVFLDDRPQPTSMVYAGTDSAVSLQDLRYGRTYWWSVTAFDADGHTFTCGPWELSIRDFDVTVDPSPADGSTQVSTAASLSWSVTEGAEMVVNWLVLLDTSPQPTTPVYTGPATSVDLSSLSLAPGTTYYWRLTALDADGFTCPLGPWSFTTAP